MTANSEDTPTTALELIEEQAEASIRRLFHEGAMRFSVVDVIGVLTDSPDPGAYWRKLKQRMRVDEGADEIVTKCHALKMRSRDGKFYATDAADAETLLRIIQSVPSPKAEPVKQWLARVGAKRLDEVTQPLPATVPNIPKPAESAPALVWADYYERLASLYRRAAAYEARLEYVDAKLEEHEDRLESVEAGIRMLPEILERLGPQTLTPEHQATVKNMTKRLSELSGIGYASIYAELNDTFHVGKYSDIPDAHWTEIMAWFERRITAAEKRRGR